jgi:hypothetical protein
VGVALQKFTPHLGLWVCLLFWFGLFLSFGLCVGSGIVPFGHHGFYVELCGCECMSMLALLFLCHMSVFLSLNIWKKSSNSKIFGMNITSSLKERQKAIFSKELELPI